MPPSNPFDDPQNQSGVMRTRMFLLVAIPLAIPLLYSLVYAPIRHGNALTDNAMRNAQAFSSLLASGVSEQRIWEDKAQLLRHLEAAGRAESDAAYFVAYGKDGAELTRHKVLPEADVPTQTPGATVTAVEDNKYLHVTVPVLRDGQHVGSLRTGFATKRLGEEEAHFRWLSFVLCLVVLAVAGAVAVFLGRSLGNLYQLLRGSMRTTAKRVDDLVNQLAAVTAEQTSAASEESTALHESNSTAADVGQAATNAAMRASALIEGGARAEEGAASGLDSVGSAISAMRQVREQMNTIGNTIGALSERAATIGEIASTVALLAERSNLLALNAAIEAARAGTQGRGFAVVAQEMRSLADGSNRSAGQVKSIIGEIQSAIVRAVADAREGERRVQNAESLADRAGENIRSFAETTREFAKLGKEIAASANQQSVAIEQMVESISHATQAGGTQLETTKQVEETARQLRQLSREMLDAVASGGSKSL
ncbi:MAG: methyl-accepting chemotaxis protein [Myxococcaceae bacterium]